MRVFVSSVVRGYEDYRAAAREAIAALDHEPVLMEDPRSASQYPPREVCLGELEQCEVVLFLFGLSYGSAETSVKSPTHEEWDHAHSRGMKTRIFMEEVDSDEYDPRQAGFLEEEVYGWDEGQFFARFSNPAELVARIVQTLRSLESEFEEGHEVDRLAALPPLCRERVMTLSEISPSRATHLVALLTDPAARREGGLSILADDPPDWLIESGHLGWEAICSFMEAHGVPGSALMRKGAIEAGSPRSGLHLIHQAVEAAENGDRDRAAELMELVPASEPLIGAAEAYISDDPSAAVEAVLAARLHESDDPDTALNGVMTMVWALFRESRFDSVREVLKEAINRFPDKAPLLLHYANAAFGAVNQIGLGAPGSRELLDEAVEFALRARDSFREWDGPSYVAVDAAMQALLALEDPQRAADLALPPPSGDATEDEAGHPSVLARLAHAYFDLGRYNDIDTIPLEEMDPSRAALIQAVQAHALGDQAALVRMRRALERAIDEPGRRRALLGLAMCGEADDVALSEVSEDEAALFRGIAAANNGNLQQAISILGPRRFATPLHAEYLARAQNQVGSVAEAIETLTDAAEHFNVESLWECVVELLIEQGELNEAAARAVAVLARNPSRPVGRRLRTRLMGIAQEREDWQAMESYGRAIVQEFSQDANAAWAVVYALHRQAKNQQAWGYIVAHDLAPIDAATAFLAGVVCQGVDATEQDARRVLEVADLFADHEEVAGSALVAALEASSGDPGVSEALLSQLNEQLEDYTARHPQSPIIRAYSGEGPDGPLPTIGAALREEAGHSAQLASAARYGLLPYSALCRAFGESYSLLLLSLSAKSITTIPADVDQRDRERQAAAAAIGGRIAIDTSAVTTCILTEIDIRRFAGVFHSVLVGDELVADARLAATSANRRIFARAYFDPFSGQIPIEVLDEQQGVMQDRADHLLEALCGWQNIPSGSMDPLSGIEREMLRPGDTAVRVARDSQLPLWCDDLALRTLAEDEGVEAFSTWALYEVLASTPTGQWLPRPLAMKSRLLRAEIADVPISLDELEQAAERFGIHDSGMAGFLSRPLPWNRSQSETFDWYVSRIRGLVGGTSQNLIPALLHAACFGLAAAVRTPDQGHETGALLAATMVQTGAPQMTPLLLAASRYAIHILDPTSGQDPIGGAVRYLLSWFEHSIGQGPAAQRVMVYFFETGYDDRITAASIILGSR